MSPQLLRNAGSASTLSKAGNTNPQPRNNAGNAGIHSQAGSANSLPPTQLRSAKSADTSPQADWSLSPSQGVSGATARDATSSPDNTTGITGEQGKRHGGQVP